jgi:hypothetical protein
LALLAGLSLIACSQPDDPVITPIDAAKPSITGQPQSGTWDVATAVTHQLMVTASVNDGGSLSYQWYSNTSDSYTDSSPIGTDSASLALNKTDYTENGAHYFYVVVTNTNNGATGNKTATRTSAVATVTVAGNADEPGTGKLANGVWKDGELTAAISTAEYTFDVENGKTYYVWWNSSFTGPTPKNKTMDISVSARYSGEAGYIFGGAGFNGINSNWVTPQFFTADKTASVTLVVTPFSEITPLGTFAVAFSTASIRPGAAVAKTITAGQWADDNISIDDIHVYTFNVTLGTQYYVWWNERDTNGNGTKTADVQVQARYADDTIIFNNNTDVYADQWVTAAWATPRSFTADRNGTVDLRVRQNNDIPGYIGTYGIVYSTDSTRPLKDNATLLSVTQNGSSGTPTTALTLLFDKAVYGLSASDITLAISNPFGVTKGTLSGTGPSYNLGVSSPMGGTVTVTVGNTLFQITGSPKDVPIYGDDSLITPLVENQWADGELHDASDNDWYKIAVSAGIAYYVWWNDVPSFGNGGDGSKTADVVVGAWRADGTNIFGPSAYLEDYGWSSPQTIPSSATDSTVYVRVRTYGTTNGYNGTYGVVYSSVNSRPEVIYPPDIPVTLTVTPNGGSGTATTALTLTFSEVITGLSAADITLSMSSPFGLTKGALSGAGPSYTLGVSSPTDGTLTVTVAKRGYEITGSPAEVNIYGAGNISVTPLVADQWVNGDVPNASSVVWYSITVTEDTTYHIWWNDKAQGDESKTGDVVVGARYADGTVIFGPTTTTVDSGWSTAQSFTPAEDGTVYLRVMPYSAGSSNTGTYGIVFSTGTTRPEY